MKTMLVAVCALSTLALTGCQTASKETLFQMGNFKVEREVKSGGLKGLITGNQPDVRTTVGTSTRKVEVRDESPGFGDLIFGGASNGSRKLSILSKKTDK